MSIAYIIAHLTHHLQPTERFSKEEGEFKLKISIICVSGWVFNFKKIVTKDYPAKIQKLYLFLQNRKCSWRCLFFASADWTRHQGPCGLVAGNLKGQENTVIVLTCAIFYVFLML